MKKTVKIRVGVYIDGANIFYQGKRSGWMVDYKKLYNFISRDNEIIVAKYFIGEPSWEPAKSVNSAINVYLEKLGYSITKKPLKKLKIADNVVKNKCNFDVEMHDEIIHDLHNLEAVYLFSGDSDFMRTKERVLASGKKIKFFAYKIGCAWEIRKSWHTLLDTIKSDIERESGKNS